MLHSARDRLLRSPSWDEVIHFLMAWRAWLLGAALGALLGALIHVLLPPLYRAEAIVLIDQNVEKIIAEDQTDLRKYIYLQRETDKLIALAWSDAVLEGVSAETGVPVADLRAGKLILSQPSDAGWRFLGQDRDPALAEKLAASWATTFYQTLLTRPAGISEILETNLVQVENLPVQRVPGIGAFLLAGSFLGLGTTALFLLFVQRQESK
ncbi:MAG: hypothetical protein N2049_10655 [Anaerolineales bacterium]|nr:hypothetical protein [Anaerolineales bacterium]MCX7609661.1 hypothetical protein [Anaerolineales bacterium]MDW8228141.1 hypothetical protein [Anaerolineales bacterium]